MNVFVVERRYLYIHDLYFFISLQITIASQLKHVHENNVFEDAQGYKWLVFNLADFAQHRESGLQNLICQVKNELFPYASSMKVINMYDSFLDI